MQNLAVTKCVSLQASQLVRPIFWMLKVQFSLTQIRIIF